MPKITNYRADIDGLRAIAVILVVLYHFSVPPVAGGFVGVDIFFVVSGYLITSIIAKELAAGRFSLLAFYDRRIRRIVPALVAVVVVSLLLGYFLLMPGDYEALGWQASTAVFGVSNFYFLWNTGYFDQTAELLPLLHTWSLGVEEQYYVVWPIVLLVVAKFARNSPIVIIAILCSVIVASLTVATVLVNQDPQAAFYLPHTRAWELALGALLVYVPRQSGSLSAATSLVGLVLILYSALTLGSKDPFPGLNAVPACLGAAMLVWPSNGKPLVSRILSFEPIRQIGLASYSIYLWHWPVLVFFRHYNLGKMPDIGTTFLLVGFSVVVGYVSLTYVERPFREMRPKRLITVLGGVAASAMVAIAGYGLAVSGGVPSRLSSEYLAMQSREVMWKWDCPYPQTLGVLGKVCVFGEPWKTSEDRVFLWGDSHAIHFAPILNTVLKPGQSAVLFFACPASMGGSFHRNRTDLPKYKERCMEERSHALSFLARTRNIKTVVLASLWKDDYLEEEADGALGSEPVFYRAIGETIDDIRDGDRRVLLVSNFASFDTDPMGCVFADSSLWRRSCADDALVLSRSAYLRKSKSIDETFARLAAQRSAVDAVFPGERMCASGVCLTTINGEFLYRDSGHIRRNLSKATHLEIAEMIGLKSAIN